MKNLPASLQIHLEVKFFDGEGELLEHGIVALGEENDVKDFRLVGLAAQRGAYEMLQKLWLRYEEHSSS